MWCVTSRAFSARAIAWSRSHKSSRSNLIRTAASPLSENWKTIRRESASQRPSFQRNVGALIPANERIPQRRGSNFANDAHSYWDLHFRSTRVDNRSPNSQGYSPTKRSFKMQTPIGARNDPTSTESSERQPTCHRVNAVMTSGARAIPARARGRKWNGPRSSRNADDRRSKTNRVKERPCRRRALASTGMSAYRWSRKRSRPNHHRAPIAGRPDDRSRCPK